MRKEGCFIDFSLAYVCWWHHSDCRKSGNVRYDAKSSVMVVEMWVWM